MRRVEAASRHARRVVHAVPARLLAAVFLAVAVGACGSSPPSPSAPSAPAVSGSPAALPAASASPAAGGQGELTVFAAASLKGVLDAMKPAFEAAAPGVTLVVSTDSSAALETQIEQGAPADVFLSADLANAQKLADAGFAAGAPQPFAGNRLLVVVPTANPAGVASPADLARPGLKVIAAGDAVPITRYALQVVAKLAALPGYPAGFAAGYAANVVSREDNVRAVVAKIELGEGDAAIVYATDAAASKKVGAIAIPDGANVVATYAGAVVRASRHPAEAAAFLAWLEGAAGQAILASFGFLPPSQ